MTEEQLHDYLLDRHETISDDCRECGGNCETEYCCLCGLHHKECDCEEPELITDTCERCKGEGIELEEI